MKRNLIKKSLLCVLSLSFCALLASCKKTSNSEKSVSKKNVFADSDVLAYAKKNKGSNKSDFKTVWTEVDTKKYDIDINNEDYAIIYDNDTADPSIYLKSSGKTININNDDVFLNGIETIDKTGNYGYLAIKYANGDVTVIDYNGNIVIEKKQAQSFSFKRLIKSKYYLDDKVKFYDLIYYYEDGEYKSNIYEVEAEVINGAISTVFERKAITIDEIDYSILDKEDDYMPLKNFDVYSIDSSFVVKDLKGNLKATFTTDLSQDYIVLDDKIIYQTTETVTINDNYTFNDDNKYYVLRTFQVDLNTGVKSEIKDYGYVIDDVSYIPAYNEKTNRTYVAGNYAELVKIENKKLAVNTISAMVDKNGCILSTKIGEKGEELVYINDNAYALYDGSVVSILDKKGNNKGSFYSSNIAIDFEEETILAFTSLTPGTTRAHILDTDLKLIDKQGIRDTYTLNLLFDDGNAIMTINDHEAALVKFENKKVEIIERYDYSNGSLSLNPSVNVIEGCKYITYNSNLASIGLYIVLVRTSSGWDVEVHTSDGALVRKIEKVTSLTTANELNSCYYLFIKGDSESYAYGTTKVSPVNE